MNRRTDDASPTRSRRVRSAFYLAFLLCVLASARAPLCALNVDAGGSDYISGSELVDPRASSDTSPEITVTSAGVLTASSESPSLQGQAPLSQSLLLNFGRGGHLGLDALGFLSPGASWEGGTPGPALGWPAIPRTARVDSLRGGSGSGGPWASAAGQRARSYQISYGAHGLELQGSFLDVDAGFVGSVGATGSGASAALERLRRVEGTRTTDMKATFRLGSGAEFASQHSSVSNDKPDDKQRGLTTTDTVHTFALALGSASQLRTTIQEHREDWDPAFAKPGKDQRTDVLEFTSQFGNGGRHDVRLALTSLQKKEGDQKHSERSREVHLNLAPTDRLSLTADHVIKDADQGPSNTTQVIGAVMKLGDDSQLAATIKNLTPGEGTGTRESKLSFHTGLGGGASTARLETEQTIARGEDSGVNKGLTWSLAGALGTGPARTNLSAAVNQQEREGASSSLARTTNLHFDRAFGPRLKLTADREEKLTQSDNEFESALRSAYRLTADLWTGSKLTAALTSQQCDSSGDTWTRDVALEQALGKARFRAAQLRQDGSTESISSTFLSLELPAGETPEWAKDMGRGHEFEEAPEYLAPKEPEWLDMSFLGFRLWAKQRRGGPDTGLDTMGFAHRRIVGGRHHFEFVYEECPESREGSTKGRPMPLRRHLLEVGTRLRHDLLARALYVSENGTRDPLAHQHTIGLGLRGSLSDRERLEVHVQRTAGRWDGIVKEENTVSLLYSRRVDEEDYLSLKVGWSRGQGEPGGAEDERRLSLGYAKPI